MTSESASRTLSLLTPSGHLTIGNYLGALRGMVAQQHEATCFYGVSDLHAMTTAHDPGELRSASRELRTLLLATGLEPTAATLFVQSRVPAHTELAYLLECVAYVGELGRMIQYKEKGQVDGSPRPRTRTSLLTYPVLMAADILLYRPREVPVGADQGQHVELARDLALRFNREYGEVFVVPELTLPVTGARVRDLQNPRRKMSKSDAAGSGVVFLLDPPDLVARKVSRAVTDSDTGEDAVRYDPVGKPGVSNLLDLLAACTNSSPRVVADELASYGELKRAVTEAVLEVLAPLQRRYAELAADPAHVDQVFEDGSAHCREETAPVLAAARAAMGLA